MEKNLTQHAADVSRIAFIGPESTGKTTLSRALAEHYRTPWVAEYMREYCQKKWDESREICSWDDILPIAYGQIESENQSVMQGGRYVFCDTCLLELVVYSYLYYGKCLPELESAALACHYDQIFLTDIDVPWVADDLRDKPQEREQVFALFQDYLHAHHIPFTVLSGSHQSRMQQVQMVLQAE